MYFKSRLPKKLACVVIAVMFLLSSFYSPALAQLNAGPVSALNLPVPGTMIPLSEAFEPVSIRGITVYPENALEFDFFVDTAQSQKRGKDLQEEADKLLKYFFASLTVPEKEMWVNLSPQGDQDIIPKGFGQTVMGRDLLAQDYILKQLTASLLYPENDFGKDFWEKVRQETQKKFNISVFPNDTLNRIWIVPAKAVVFESGYSAFVVESRLQVMLEVDYLEFVQGKTTDVKPESEIVDRAIREIVLPKIEEEINQGETFSSLRQIYQSMILATWYKQKVKTNILSKVYVDKNKPRGVHVKDPNINQKIYAQYMEAFKRGVYNIVKEDYDPTSKQMIPRKYFSGGAKGLEVKDLQVITDQAMLSDVQQAALVGNRFWKFQVKAVENPKDELIEQQEAFDLAMVVDAVNEESEEVLVDKATAVETGLRVNTPQGPGEIARVYKGAFAWRVTYIDVRLDSGEELNRIDVASKEVTRRFKVLLVDDQERYRAYYTQLLTPYVDIVPAANAQEAIAVAREDRDMDAVITDYEFQQRRRSGIEILNRLSRMGFEQSQMLMLTGLPVLEIRQRLDQEGFDIRMVQKRISFDDEGDEDTFRRQFLDVFREILPDTSLTSNDVSEDLKEDQGPQNNQDDKALLSNDLKDVGGINLDASLIDIQIKRDGRGVPLGVDEQPFANMKIDGFLPVIFNMIPLAELPVPISYNKNEPQSIKYVPPESL